jgi:hypothetical protein
LRQKADSFGKKTQPQLLQRDPIRQGAAASMRNQPSIAGTLVFAAACAIASPRSSRTMF